ncbi:Uncharacterised protein [uncultured archaeon]|nr:Uncharacterised protein [uncultured archaeon]
MVLIMAALCLAALTLGGMAAAADAQATQNQLINSYTGNLTEKQLAPVDMVSLFGRIGFFVAEAVKFKAPKAGWKLNQVQLIGWDGYNGTAATVPQERIIALEVRDKNLNLLYKFADSQLPYSNYARNATEMYPLTIEIPSIPVSDDFYVCFYDRGAVSIACEKLNQTSENSFLYIEAGNELVPSNLIIADNQTLPVNWIMTLSGN